MLATMTAECPVHHSDHYGGHWVVTGYDAHFAMHHYEIFNRHPSASVPSYPRPRPMIRSSWILPSTESTGVARPRVRSGSHCRPEAERSGLPPIA